MKRCPRCDVDKPEAEFNRNRSSKDGLHFVCKLCHRADAKKWQSGRGKTAHYEATQRWKNGNGKESRKATDRRMADRHPTHVAARKAVRAARLASTLVKSDTCERCMEPGRIQAHHDSYDPAKWLVVRWLCSTCHAAWHRENDAEEALPGRCAEAIAYGRRAIRIEEVR